MLKPTALKGARWVLRGEGGGNASPLPDNSLQIQKKWIGWADSQKRKAKTDTVQSDPSLFL
jgi:hypothetical protein